MAKRIATIMGVVFILAGIAGFVSNDLLGFHLTFFHNAAVHIVSGAVSLYFGLRGTPAGARMFQSGFRSRLWIDRSRRILVGEQPVSIGWCARTRRFPVLESYT